MEVRVLRILRAEITDRDDGIRLRSFLRRLGVGESLLASLKAHNAVTVNGRVCPVAQILRAGDRVEAHVDEHAPRRVEPEALPVRVVWEDEDLMILDKPAPLACQCTAAQPRGTLENRLAARCGPDFVFHPVNRLDKGTSGLMTVAKNRFAVRLLQPLLHTDAFVREYLAVTCGDPGGRGVIDLPLARETGSVRRVPSAEGRACGTLYETLRTAGGFSLVRLRLLTGRTHQIRAHLSAVGCPIAGDFLYGSEDPRLPGRFALHSCGIRFTHPLTGQVIEARSPLPAELAALLEP